MQRLVLLFALVLAGCNALRDSTTSVAITPGGVVDAATARSDTDLVDAATAFHPDAAKASCASDIAIAGPDGCRFYDCREAEHPCGAAGYYLGYGKKYCERFLVQVRPVLSPAGQTFLDVGRDCLMHAIDANIGDELSCDQIRTDALASHVVCYRASGFCQLPVSDKAALFFSVDASDRDLVSMFETQLACF